jgi:hypothetical protein
VDNPIHTGPEPKTQATSDRLTDLEQIITRGKAAYLEVGEALDEIRDNKLYKAKYPTFEAYLKGRWQMSRAQGYRLIAAVKIAEMSPIGDKPENEHQARKRRYEKRAKRKSETKQPARVINDIDEELDRFKEMVQEWKDEFLDEELRKLLDHVKDHADEMLTNLEETDLSDVQKEEEVA